MSAAKTTSSPTLAENNHRPAAHMAMLAFLVEILALGSVFLSGNRISRIGYLIYSLATTLFLVYSFSVSTVGNIIVGGVVYGEVPLITIISSLAVKLEKSMKPNHSNNIPPNSA